ncbi:MAG TPA: Rrf2 family transcriptional regulator [Nannocystaceae bacterium]|nr:Rrf2 family transcriptional regulator [Nannocystaceae bacterium]
MRRDSRLSVALHVLLHMHEREEAVSSEVLAEQMGMNPVVLRRTMAGLRDAGIVRSEKGHGGGWALARPLADVTLAEIYDALGTPTLFGLGPRVESPGCLVEQAVNRALTGALEEARALWLARMQGISLADLAKDVRRRGGVRSKKGVRVHA